MPNFKTPEQVKALCERLIKVPAFEWKHTSPCKKGSSKLATDLTLLLLSYEQMYNAYTEVARAIDNAKR